LELGENSAIAQMSDRAGFLLQGDTSTEQAADTNETWERNKRRNYRYSAFRASA